VLVTQDGRTFHQDLVGTPDQRSGRKFYIRPDQSISWAGLVRPAGGSLWMEWGSAQMPYCGVWIDEGALNKVAAVAIEPTTGYYDSLTTAWQNQRLAKLEPEATATWQFVVILNARSQTWKK
jgi:hypothetical protein